MADKPVSNGSTSRAFRVATEALVEMLIGDLHDPKNQGPNFDPRTFPIDGLVAAFLRGDPVFAASEGDIDDAKVIAKKKWAAAWDLDPSELVSRAKKPRQNMNDSE
jgi:hypothetical protein